ncbi:MAG: 16S rRNA (cytidine(1402)-2'-O)-methyltransferase [Maricaulis sp.]|jgi:16S rRNA (cytidine1402-2'-O)-methyltransferase|nr:16S rRNA (cytidine(1402)-2'-O)-methyltransferase [Maricaulis sp.]
MSNPPDNTPENRPDHRFAEASRPLPPGQPPEPGLHLVATPIGNLRDITLRALDTLAGADLVLAEDTRVAAKLLNAYGISVTCWSFHDHNEDKQSGVVIERLRSGERIALISDAGTPLVSDPGFKLARAVIEAGLPVHVLPGASSVLAALSLAGLPSDSFFFGGFLPNKSGARIKRLEVLKAIPGTLIVFETAPRLVASLADMADVLGDRPAAVTRELTKKFEEARRGTLRDLADHYAEAGPPKGEIVVVIGPPDAGGETWDTQKVDAALADRVAAAGVKQASMEIATLSGWNKREVYARALALKDRG